MSIQQIVNQAAEQWKLEELSLDLGEAKRLVFNAPKQARLSTQELDCLCGLLCGYSPKQIAKLLNVKVNGLRVNLSHYLYRYLETLVQGRTGNTPEIAWAKFPQYLEELGYKRTFLPPPTEKWVKWRLSIDVSEISPENLAQIQALLQQIPGNASMRLDKIEQGSIQLVFNGYLAGFEQIRERFETGELSQLLGVTILGVQLEPMIEQSPPVNLSLWLQTAVNDVIDEGWQTIDELFGMRSPAFRSDLANYAKDIEPGPDLPTIQQGKSIVLGTASLALLVKLSQESEEGIDILVRVFPIQESTDLPEQLKLMVLDEQGEVLEEVTAGRGNNCIEQPLSGEPGEGFVLKLELGELSATESFIV
ncbi:DUF1822 family protein [Laspinema sp. D1]|uniref:DUF1822 family protein n=1 Tax=Laspinema palackyanum D2a TaxID=2953684 RepID=A0ABT2MLF6_9CYAN|nr:DUF1822 family protein [Laspinema sp. D2a]